MDSGLAATYTLIHSFLLKQAHGKAAEAVKKAAKDIVILKDDVTLDGPQLDEIIQQWRGMSEKDASKDSSDSDSSSSSGSESDSDSSSSSASTTPSVADKNDAKLKSIKVGNNTDDSDSDSSSSSSSSTPATKSTPIAKGIVSRSSDESGSSDSDTSSSSSDSSSNSKTARVKTQKVSSSSSSNSSDSESGSSSDSDSTLNNRSKSPKSAVKLKKKRKTAGKQPSNKSSSGSDSSSSESESGSESDDESSDSDSDPKTIPKLDEGKKVVLNDERDSSKTLSTGLSDAEKSRKRKKRSDDSSNDDSSSSTSSSESSGSNSSSGGESNAKLSPVISKGSSGPEMPTTKKLKTSVNGDSVATTTNKDQSMNQFSKTKRTTNAPFKRVDPSKLNVNLTPVMDNRYEAKAGPSDDYGQRAHQDLIVTRGAGFRKEKNKKKRGSYKGGAITMESHSFKFT